jgi:misacylated tRNA(Ala) deacylase
MAITPENVERLEELVNAAIRDSLPMTVHLYKTLDEAKRDPDIRLSRELPESLEGVVRMIKIAGVDMNACCGTHMASTASLQLVKFGGIQSSRGNARVFFVAGGRALAYFSRLQRVERELTAVLCASSSEHAALVRKLHTEARATGKTLTKTQEELAALLAERAVAAGGVASLLREEADFPLAAFVDAVKARAPNALGLAAAGEKGAAGQFVVFGPEALVAELGPKVAQLLEGKGGGRQGKFQGKSQSLARFGDALKLCAERLAAAPKQ